MMGAPDVVLAAEAALTMKSRSLRTALLPRVLGLYIAALAGGIQLLDIAIDRFALDDRVFTFALTLAIIGIPFAGAGAVLLDTARAERRPPQRRSERSRAGSAAAQVIAVDAAAPDYLTHDAVELPRRLDLALSYVRIARLHAETGDEEVATAHRLRAAAELHALIERLEHLLTETAAG